MGSEPPNPDEAAIAEFHRAARKRKALVFARTIVIGIGLIAAGLWMIWNALRLGSGKINDV
jgi:Na+/phosphate symporter